jgi:SAM-dependent methyltransferase
MTIEAYVPKHSFISTALASANSTLNLAEAKVLELYGNAGTLLNDPENLVEEENYTVFDYDQEAIDLGREDFADADFREWNIHNQMNNPGGDIDAPLPWNGDEKFDLIFTYMKTANEDPSTLFRHLDECYEHLNEGGSIIFSVFLREVALNYFIVRRTHEYGMLDNDLIENTENSNVFCLINNDDSRIDVESVPTEGDDAVLEAQHYTWFWNNEYLTQRTKDAFPNATVTSRRLPPMWSIQNPYIISK